MDATQNVATHVLRLVNYHVPEAARVRVGQVATGVANYHVTEAAGVRVGIAQGLVQALALLHVMALAPQRQHINHYEKICYPTDLFTFLRVYLR